MLPDYNGGMFTAKETFAVIGVVTVIGGFVVALCHLIW
jgi:hypothetical protein